MDVLLTYGHSSIAELKCDLPPPDHVKMQFFSYVFLEPNCQGIFTHEVTPDHAMPLSPPQTSKKIGESQRG